MGHDARQCPRVHPASPVGRHLPGSVHPRHGARHQPHRRRPPRRARSETEAELTHGPEKWTAVFGQGDAQMSILDIRNLTVSFDTSVGLFKAVEGIDLSVDAREVLAIVGESGSSKSVEMLALMGLLPASATVTADKLEFDGKNMLNMSRAQRREIVG